LKRKIKLSILPLFMLFVSFTVKGGDLFVEESHALSGLLQERTLPGKIR